MLLPRRPRPSSSRFAAAACCGVLLVVTGCGARFPTAEQRAADGTLTGGQVAAGQPAADGGLGEAPADAPLADGAVPAGPEAPAADAGPDGGTTTSGSGGGAAAAPGPAAGAAGGSTGSTGSTGSGGGGTAGGSTGSTGGGGASAAPAAAAPASKGSQFGIKGKTVTICYLFPKTGAAPLPPNVADAIEAYWDFVNSKGGLGGFKIDPEICDTQSTVAGSQAAVQKAVDIKAFAVTTLDRLEPIKTASELLFKAGIPNISLLNAPEPPEKWKKQTFFVSTDQGSVGTMVSKYFQARKFANVAVVSEANDVNVPKVLAPFLKGASSRGQKVVSSNIKLDPNNSSGYATQCAQLASKDPDAVWVYTAPTPAIQFVNACGSFKPVWFSSEYTWDYNIAPGAAPGLRGAEGFGRWATLSETQRIAPFRKAFGAYIASGRSQGGESGNTKTLQDLALLAWGESQILANGILNAAKSPAGLGRDSFIAAMRNLKLGSTSPADGSPLLWAPLDFTGGKFFGAPDTTSVWKVSSGAEPIWERVSGYQKEF